MAKRTITLLAVGVATLLSLASHATAQNIFWNGTGATWNSTSDWWTTAAGTSTVGSFSGATIIANFNATSVTSAQVIALDANQVVQGLVFTGTDAGGETINNGAGSNLTIGAGGIMVNPGSGSDTINAALHLSAAQTWMNNSANTLAVSGTISDGGQNFGLSFAGVGTVALSGSNTYGGATTLSNNLGTLLLDFSAAGAPVTNIINNSVAIVNNNITTGSSLVLGGGTLSITGASGATNNQAFNGTTVGPGASVIAFNDNGSAAIILQLGAITRSVAGGGVTFPQDNINNDSIYTTTPNPTFTGGTTNSILGGWAVYTPTGQPSPNTWATSTGAPGAAGLIIGLQNYAVANAATPFTAGADIDASATNATGLTNITINSLRFSTAAGVTSSIAANNTLTIASGGILLTNAVGGNTETINQTAAPAFITSGNGTDLIINQYNPATPDRSLTISARTTDNGATPIGLTKNGPGLFAFATSNASFSGNVFINGGTLQTGSGFNNGNNPTPTTATSALGLVGAGTSSRSITVGPGAFMIFTTNNVLTGSSGSLANSAANTPTLVVNGGTFFSSRYNAIGNITLNSGAMLSQSATDGSGTGSYQGFQLLGSVSAGGTSGSSIISGSGAGNHLFPAANGGTTFNVAATGGAGPDLAVSAPLINASGDYGAGGLATASSLIKTGAGTMRVSGAGSFTGGTTLNAGTMVVAQSNTALGTGGITLSGGRLQLQGVATGSIGIQFGAGATNGGTGLTSGQTAGVPGVAMANWNISGAINQGTPLALVDNSGAATATTVTWANTADIWHTGATGGTANTTLMSGYLDSNGGTSPSVTFSGVPYSQYSAYIYTGSDGNNRGGTTSNSQNSTTYYWATNVNGTSFANPPPFKTTNNTNPAISQTANYLLFNGLNNTDNSNQITFTSGFGKGPITGNGNAGITAIEIVNTVPNSALVMPNNVTLTTDSTIDVTGFSSDTISGQLSMGTNKLSVTGGSTGAGAGYTLSLGTVGGVSLTGNPTFDVANNGAGTGALALGALNDNLATVTIVKQNSGTLNLTAGGTMVATSQVNVTGGTLRVTSGSSAATGSAPVTIFTGATLAGPNTGGGLGTIGSAATVNTGASLAGGSLHGLTTLTLSGGLTLQSGTSSTVTLSDTANGTADPTQAIFATSGGGGASSLVVGGSHLINLLGAPSLQATSTYDLFSYTGAQLTSGQFSNFSLGASLPESNFLNYALVNASNQVDLVVTFKGLTWTGRTGGTGAVNGAWDVSTSNNWANTTPAASVYTDGGGVLFGDKNPLSSGNNVGTSAVAIQAGGVSPASILFTNTGAAAGGVDYTFSGGSINGTTGIAVNGAGGVTFQSANAFSGAVFVNAGHLQLQNGTALGNSFGVTVAAGTALELASGSGTSATYGSRADSTGTIGLILNGAGRTGNAAGALNSINGVNTYAGPITTGSAGATIDSNSSANGDQLTLSGAITLPAGATLNIGAVGPATLSGGVALGGGSTLNIAGAGAVTASTVAISGGGSIVYAGTGSGSLTLAVDNSYSGSTTVNSNSVILNTPNGLGNSSGVTVAGGAGGALVLNNTSGTPATFGNAPAGGTIPLIINGAGNASAPGALASIFGNNTYAGAITLGSSASIASTSTAVGDGLSLAGGITIPAAATLTLKGAGNTTVTAPSTITGGGALLVNAAPGGTVALIGSNSYSAGTTVQAGTLAVFRSNTPLGAGTVTLAGGRLQLQGGPGTVPTGKGIGINFEGGSNGGAPTSLAAGDTAGVVSQANWNNAPGQSGTAVDSPMAGTIVDSNGLATAATVFYTSNGTWGVGQPVLTDGNHELMNGYLDNTNAGTPTTVALANIPYASYSVYGYLGSDGNGRTGHATINGNSIYFSTNDNPFGGFVQATGTSVATANNATYVLFTGLNGSSVTYTETRDTNNVGLTGIQIVDTTGPSTLANNVAVTSGSTIDVSGFSAASLSGPVTVGNTGGGTIQLSITGAGAGSGSNYSLSLGSSLALTGTNTNYIFDVASNSTGTGTGTLIAGALSGGATARTITLQNSGTVILGSAGTLATGSTVNVGPAAGGNGGNLRVTNTSGSATGSAGVVVNGGGTLFGSTAAAQGFITGAVTVGSVGTLVGGSGATLTLSGGLTLQGGSLSAFTLGTPANGTANPAIAFVATTGGAGASSLAITGSNTISLTGAPPLAGSSTYDLFSYSGTQLTTAQFNNFSLGGSLPQNNIFNYALVNGSKQVDLVVTLNPLTWTGRTGGTGAVNGSWDSSSSNWANSTPAATTYVDGVAVAFGDKNPLSPGGTGPVGTSAITVQAGGVSPLAVLFTNTGAAAGGVDYTFTSASGPINGTATLALTGAGGVILQAPNNFSGAVAVNAGHLQLQNTSAEGNSSGATVASGGALELASGSGTSATYGNRADATGTIGLTLNGAGLAASPAGALNSMNGINTYAGLVSIGSPGATIASNSNAGGDQLTLSGGISLASGATLTVAGVGPTFVTTAPVNVTAGGGTINSNGATGLTISGGAVIASGGTLTLGGSSNTTVDTSAIGDGGAGAAGSLAYSGTGTASLTLAVDNSYYGSTTINSNSVILTTANGLGNSSGVTVVGGAGGALVLNNTSGNPMTFGATVASPGVTVPLTLNGAGSASAAGALASIAGNNTYTGLVGVGASNAATVTSASTAAGDGLTLNGGITLPTNAALTLTGAGNTLIATGPANVGVTGGGALVVNTAGAGTATISTSNSYSGGTTVQHGTLAVVGSNTALGAGTVTLAGGRLQLQGGPGTVPTGKSIGVNFEGGQSPAVGPSLLPTDTAGVISQANWNNTPSNNGSTASVDSPIAGTVVDATGTATPVTISYSSTNTWSVAQAGTDGNSQLMNGYLDNTGTPQKITFANVPYASFSVYAYVGSDGNGRTGHGTINGNSIYFTTSDSPFGGFVQATGTSVATANASNYLLFPGVGGPNFTYTEPQDTANVGLHGIQIVDTTGSLALTNNVAVTADSTIDVSGVAGGGISGPLSIGTNTLFLTGGSTGTNAPYSLNLGAATLGGNPTFNVADNGSGTGTLVLASLSDGGSARTITKANSGTLEIQGASTLTAGPTAASPGTSILVNAGTLRFNNTSGAANIGAALSTASAVTVTVASGATLELAGSVSDLSDPSAATHRAHIVNNSKQASGGSLLVSGTNQQVGAVDGTGDTVVNAGGSLTANHIIQNALVIGGTGASAGTVTIAASDASGNSLAESGGFALAGSIPPSAGFGAGTLSSSSFLASGGSAASGASLSGSGFGGSVSSVPEPSSILLLVLGGLACALTALRRRKIK